MEGRVFIVQEPQRRNHGTGEMESFMDFTPASAYGMLQPSLVRPGAITTLAPAPMIRELSNRLSRFSPDDCLVLVGDPVAIGAAIMVAHKACPSGVNVLKWNRETGAYIRIKLEV